MELAPKFYLSSWSVGDEKPIVEELDSFEALVDLASSIRRDSPDGVWLSGFCGTRLKFIGGQNPKVIFGEISKPLKSEDDSSPNPDELEGFIRP